MKEKILIYLLVTLALSSAIYLIFNMMYPKKDFPYAEVSSKQAYKEADNITIIDIRPQKRCEATGKAKGAYNLPIEETTSPKEYLEKAREKAKGKTIAFMCNTGKSSKMVSMQYREIMNAKDVTSLIGGMEGINGWLAEGLPTESCTQ